MNNDDTLIKNIIEALVLRYGHDRVRRVLYKVVPKIDNSQSETDLLPGFSVSKTKKKKSRRKTAVEIVLSSELSDEVRKPLLEIATRFDSRRFLPTARDIGDFLILHGGNEPNTTDRSTAFRRLLALLKVKPLDVLRDFASSHVNSGPARLGPLSEAISEAGQSLVRASADIPNTDAIELKSVVGPVEPLKDA